MGFVIFYMLSVPKTNFVVVATSIKPRNINNALHFSHKVFKGWITDRDSSKAIKDRDESQEGVETKPVINGDLETREGLLMTAGQGGTPHLATGSLGTDPSAPPATHRPG